MSDHSSCPISRPFVRDIRIPGKTPPLGLGYVGTTGDGRRLGSGMASTFVPSDAACQFGRFTCGEVNTLRRCWRACSLPRSWRCASAAEASLSTRCTRPCREHGIAEGHRRAFQVGHRYLRQHARKGRGHRAVAGTRSRNRQRKAVRQAQRDPDARSGFGPRRAQAPVGGERAAHGWQRAVDIVVGDIDLSGRKHVRDVAWRWAGE